MQGDERSWGTVPDDEGSWGTVPGDEGSWGAVPGDEVSVTMGFTSSPSEPGARSVGGFAYP